MASDFQKQRYASRRTVAFAKNGMCATSVAAAGPGWARRSAPGVAPCADAAVAMAAVLAVTEPTSNGLPDAFALVWSKGKLYGLNASGTGLALLSLSLLRSRGYERMPMRGWETVMVPGAPAAAERRAGRRAAAFGAVGACRALRGRRLSVVSQW